MPVFEEEHVSLNQEKGNFLTFNFLNELNGMLISPRNFSVGSIFLAVLIHFKM